MGQKVHPYGFRLGIFEDWKSHWFAKKGSYGKEVLEDLRIRNYLKQKFSKTDVADVVIEKAVDSIRIVVHSAKPGLIIGKKGYGIEKLRADLCTEFKKKVDISVQEVKGPELNARLIAESIAEQLEKRAKYKRLMKKAGFAALKGGAKGIKICCSGRLGGAEIARSEWLRLGSIPLHTLRSKVDFSLAEAMTTHGMIGVKVWLCRGEY